MKFDLFDVMSSMKKEFGYNGEVLLTQNNTGITVRLSVFSKGIFHHSEFTVSTVEIMTGNYVKACSLKFNKALVQLQLHVKN